MYDNDPEGELSMPATHGHYSSISSRLDYNRNALTAGVVPR